MRTIDMKNWPRRQHFDFFNKFDHPHFGLSANVDLTTFYPALKHYEVSFTIGIVYAITRAANAIPEFRQRIRLDQVVEHEVVHPSFTLLTDNELFGFCTLEYGEDFKTFAEWATQKMAYVKGHPNLENEPGDDFLYMTAIPWISFTSFMHPIHLNPPDSIPRFAWGKFFNEGSSLKMPVGVQVHHALMDGIHMAKFYAELEVYLNNPESWLEYGN
jgi:chloramphenicol O-acetyltransferase type A